MDAKEKTLYGSAFSRYQYISIATLKTGQNIVCYGKPETGGRALLPNDRKSRLRKGTKIE
jgi:hypothetical protein